MADYTLSRLYVDGRPGDKWEIVDEAGRGFIATEYAPQLTYSKGSIVIYSGHLYECNTDITTPEAWTAAHWTAVTIGKQIEKLGLSVVDGAINITYTE